MGVTSPHGIPWSQQGLLATYLIPGCVGRGVRLGSESSSGAGGSGGFGASGGVWKSGGHFSEGKTAPAATYPQVQGFQKYGGHFSEKKAPAATYPQVEGFQKSRGHFSGKKGACGNVPTSSGLPKIWGPFFWRKKKRLRQCTHKFRASRNLAPLGFRPKNKVFERLEP